MDARELLTANLELIDRVIGFTCRRQRLSEDDAEEFASTVKLKLVENDYAILGKFQGRSSFATFISVVIQRMLLDYRVHLWGKWHPSAEAKRLGDSAVELEKLLFRDHRSIEEATTILRGRDPSMTSDAVRQLASRIPPRGPRRREVDIEEAQSVAAGNATEVELDADRAVTSRRLSEILARAMAGLPQQDRLILSLRFEEGLTVAQIARALEIDQKLLYRRMEKHFRGLRTQIEQAGIASKEALDLVGSARAPLDFGLRNGAPRPSNRDGGATVAGQEGITR